MQAFERKVQEMEAANLDAVSKGLDALQSRLEKQDEMILARFATGVSSAPPPAPPAPAPARVLQEQAVVGDEDRRAAVEFAGITLAREDAKLIAATVSAGILAWAFRGWVGL
jgi:hypothetical protein